MAIRERSGDASGQASTAAAIRSGHDRWIPLASVIYKWSDRRHPSVYTEWLRRQQTRVYGHVAPPAKEAGEGAEEDERAFA